MILQTGGLLFGEISTRSMPASMAILMAVTVSMVPLLEPSTSISWICALRISSLMRGPSLATAGGALLGRRMGSSPGLLKEGAILKQDAATGKRTRAFGAAKPSNALHFGHAGHIEAGPSLRKQVHAGIVDGSIPLAEKGCESE